MTLAEAVSKRTKQLLFAQNKTQYKLIKEMGLSKTSIRYLNNGKSKSVNLTTVVLIAEFFGMSLAEFFEDDIFKYENLDE